MRCSITLTIISAVTLSAAYLEDSAQFSSSYSSVQLRDSDHRNSLYSRSPIPGIAHSTTNGKEKRRKAKDLNNANGNHGVSVVSGKIKRPRRIVDLPEPDRTLSIVRLEKKYGFKNMGLPPMRHTQSAPGLENHGTPWSPLRDRKDPAYTTSQSRAAYIEKHPSSSPPSLNSSPPSRARPKFSSSPADSMLRYDVLARKPGDPGYIAPSAFRASNVPERSMISIPSRKPPRQRDTGSGLDSLSDKKFGCFGCFGLGF